MTISAREMFRFAKALEGAVRGDEKVYIQSAGKGQGEDLPIVGIFQDTMPHLDAASEAAIQTWMDGAATFNPNRKDLVARSRVANELVTNLAAIGVNTGVKPPPWRQPPSSWYKASKPIAWAIRLVDMVAYELGELKTGSDWNAPVFASEDELLARVAAQAGDEGKPRLMIVVEAEGRLAEAHGGVQFRILLGPDGQDYWLSDLVPQDLRSVDRDAIKRGCLLQETQLIVSGQVWREHVLPAFEARYSGGQRFPCRHCDALGRTSPPSLEEPRGKKCSECWGRGFINDLDHRVLIVRKSIAAFLNSTAGQELTVSEVMGLLPHTLEIVRAMNDSIALRTEILGGEVSDEDEPFVQPLASLCTWAEAAEGIAATISVDGQANSQEWTRDLLTQATELINTEEVHWPFSYVQRINLIIRAARAALGRHDDNTKSDDPLPELLDQIENKTEELKKLCGWSAFS